MSVLPQPPVRRPPAPDWEHYELYERVKRTLTYELPAEFATELRVTGALANDLQAFASPVGGIIEGEAVRTLNKLRDSWDPNNLYKSYRFVRQSQTFPDVILTAPGSNDPERVLMGIELKGWYALAKERMPNFRFIAMACPLSAPKRDTLPGLQSACQGTVSDLALAASATRTARRRSRRRGNEETRPLDGRAGIRRGSRTTASGGDTTSSGPAPPALAR